MPDEPVDLGQVDAFLGAVIVEEAQLNRSATSENTEKPVPTPSQVAPSG